MVSVWSAPRQKAWLRSRLALTALACAKCNATASIDPPSAR